MLGGQVALLTYQAGLYLSTGAVPGLIGNAHPMIAPYDTFATADGYVNIAVGNDSLWERFCTALDLASLLDEDGFSSNAGRSTNREALYATLEPRLKALTTEEVVRRLDEAGVPCGPIRDVAQTMEDGQTRAQDLILEVEHPRIGPLRVSGAPYHFDGEPVRARLPPPLLGQQTSEILAEAGYGAEEIEALVASGAAQVDDA
jgi:crotonobetainyl-CoA:carnitine CoA-transferase CaiB-like acyl-CoA transferase